MKKPNIILITLDALRPDHLGFMGYSKNTSPFLNSLAKKGVIFKNTFSVGTATPQAFPGIMSSTYPTDYGGYGRIGPPRAIISEVLQKAGYFTAGFHSNAYLSAYFGYDRGWNIFRHLHYFSGLSSEKAFKKGTVSVNILRSVYLVRQWLRKNAKPLEAIFNFIERFVYLVRQIFRDIFLFSAPAYFIAEEMNKEVINSLSSVESSKPLFLWVHYMDMHAPYGLFLRKRGFFSRLKYYFVKYLFDFCGGYFSINRFFVPLYVSLYDASLQYLDNSLRNLFSHLESEKILTDKDVVIITADHGEEFFDHGGFQHGPKLFNTNIRVPLIVIAPEKYIGKPRHSDLPTSTIDIAPTIADFAGAVNPPSFRGKNIFQENLRPVFAEATDHNADLSNIRIVGTCVVAENHKFIEAGDKKILFVVDDKKEERNIYDERKGIALRLEEKLNRFRHSSR